MHTSSILMFLMMTSLGFHPASIELVLVLLFPSLCLSTQQQLWLELDSISKTSLPRMVMWWAWQESLGVNDMPSIWLLHKIRKLYPLSSYS